MKRAFTLIELLVVVAIIAVLVAVLLPALNSARARAQAIVCQSNLKQVVQGLVVYDQEYQWVPQYWIYPGSGTGSRGIKYYIDRVGVWGAPEDRNRPLPDSLNMARRVKPFCLCPTGDVPASEYPPIPSNGWWRAEIYSYGAPDSVGLVYSDGSGFVRLDRIERPAAEPCFGDSCASGTDLQISVLNRRYHSNNYAVSLRHVDRGNVAFADGHVAALDLGQAFGLGFAGVRPEKEGIALLNPRQWPRDY